MKIVIACDSSADLNKELYKENDIRVLPYKITMGDNEYQDGVNLDPAMIFDFVAKNKTLPKTSAINQYEYEEFFKKEKGDADALIFFSLSSGITSSCNNAINASKNVEGVYVIDSLSLSSGIGLQVLYACRLRAEGLDAEEIVKKVEARRGAVQASFITYKLDYLHKGGRCSSLQLLGANLLKIRPSIVLSNGKMQMHKKYMGRPEKVDLEYLKDTVKEFNNPDNTVAFITFATATPEILEIFRKFVKENTNFKKVYETNASATITAHCGENTIGLIYYNEGGDK